MYPTRGDSARTGQIPRRHKNGEYAAKPPARPAFQRHEAHAEGNDTTPRIEVPKKHCVQEGTACPSAQSTHSEKAVFSAETTPRGVVPTQTKRPEGSDTAPTQKCRKNAKREFLSPPTAGLSPKPSEAVSVGRGRATESASPAAYDGTRDSSSARTTASIAFVWSAAKPLPCQMHRAGKALHPNSGQKPGPTFSYDWRKT